jgi:glycerol-3-phosphate acyltransferase PlsX
LRESSLNYAGFIEGHDLFGGRVDVAVCDGFSGNLVLKSSEGLGGLLLDELKRTLNTDFRTRLGAMLAGPALRRMLAHLDPGKHNGAPLLGLDGVVVKSHGRADRSATVQALREAAREVQRRVPERIRAAIHQYEEENLL